MDSPPIASLVRTLTQLRSRRAALSALAGALVPLGSGVAAMAGGSPPHSQSPTCKDGRVACPGAHGKPTCVNLQTDARHCGDCATSCPVGETCRDGQCRCGASPTATPMTCCPDGQHEACAGPTSGQFTVADTCKFVFVCPRRYTPCIGADAGGQTCRACCPPRTICDAASGVCRQGRPARR